MYTFPYIFTYIPIYVCKRIHWYTHTQAMHWCTLIGHPWNTRTALAKFLNTPIAAFKLILSKTYNSRFEHQINFKSFVPWKQAYPVPMLHRCIWDIEIMDINELTNAKRYETHQDQHHMSTGVLQINYFSWNELYTFIHRGSPFTINNTDSLKFGFSTSLRPRLGVNTMILFFFTVQW